MRQRRCRRFAQQHGDERRAVHDQLAPGSAGHSGKPVLAVAKDLREAHRRGEELGLSEDELAFYDALETNDSAVAVLGDQTLKQIAQELVTAVKGSVTVDWSVRESARARMRVIVKRLLRKYGYPPDKQERATVLVLQQAEVLSEEWAA